ncbi:hypothetical protein CMUS01_03942 [Colletotrichum musicola]|uniref:Uncharacterized protein n=1 Tax=Colletotrichum musicola TaxID=2175873 RepID=A0A8H6U587_9PEZI|nr:hypothetical protein CMUS01_03942 [Colletotrichum musicola]
MLFILDPASHDVLSSTAMPRAGESSQAAGAVASSELEHSDGRGSRQRRQRQRKPKQKQKQKKHWTR